MGPLPSRPPPKAGRLWKKYRQEIPDTFPVAVDTDGRVGLGVPNLVIGTPSGRASSFAQVDLLAKSATVAALAGQVLVSLAGCRRP